MTEWDQTQERHTVNTLMYAYTPALHKWSGYMHIMNNYTKMCLSGLEALLEGTKEIRRR